MIEKIKKAGPYPSVYIEADRIFVEAIGVNMAMCMNESFFGLAGKSEGLEPVIIQGKHVRKHSELFKAFGFGLIETANSNLSVWDYVSALMWTIKKTISIKNTEELLKLDYQGIHIGELVFSSYIYRHMTGTIKKIKPDISIEIFKCCMNYKYFTKLVAKHKPRFAVVTNNTYVDCGMLFKILLKNGVPAYVNVWPAFNKVSIKKYEKDQDNRDLCVVNPTAAEWKNISESMRGEWVEYGKKWIAKRVKGEDSAFGGADAAVGKPWLEKDKVVESLGIDKTKKTGLICAHVMWDDPLIYSSIFKDYYWWWVETAKIINEIEHINWILKAHPGEMDTLGRKTFQKPIRSLDALKDIKFKPHVKLLDSGLTYNNYSLTQVVDFVVTLRGTVGLEYSCLGIPVITAGTGPYSICGFASVAKSVEEYKKALSNAHLLDRLEESKRNEASVFAYYYLSGATSIAVQGTLEDFDITKLKDSFYNDFRNDSAWKTIMSNMKKNMDCRS